MANVPQQTLLEWRGYVKFVNTRIEERLGVVDSIWRHIRDNVTTAYYIMIYATRVHNLICLQFDGTGLLQAAPVEPHDTIPLSFTPSSLMQLCTPFYRIENRDTRQVLLIVTPDGRLGMVNENIEQLIDTRFAWNVTYLKLNN